MLMYSKPAGVEQVSDYEKLVNTIETGFSLTISNSLNRTGKRALCTVWHASGFRWGSYDLSKGSRF